MSALSLWEIKWFLFFGRNGSIDVLSVQPKFLVKEIAHTLHPWNCPIASHLPHPPIYGGLWKNQALWRRDGETWDPKNLFNSVILVLEREHVNFCREASSLGTAFKTKRANLNSAAVKGAPSGYWNSSKGSFLRSWVSYSHTKRKGISIVRPIIFLG